MASPFSGSGSGRYTVRHAATALQGTQGIQGEAGYIGTDGSQGTQAQCRSNSKCVFTTPP